MKTILKPILFSGLAIVLAACCGNGDKAGAASELSARLEALVADGKIMYGHQDDLCYGHAWKVEDAQNDPLERSDIKDVCGHYPAVLGLELGELELGGDKSLDAVPFTLIRRAAVKHHERGGVVTFSWHARNLLTGGDAWDISSDQVVASILEGGENHAKFQEWLKILADFFDTLRDADGNRIPFIFRPWHEHTGSWFWWGQRLCTTEQYKALWRMTYDYLAGERGLDNMLWCYSPSMNVDVAGYMERYPGDDLIDILGVDGYTYFNRETGLEASCAKFSGELRSTLEYMTSLGKEHGKIITLSETGLESIPSPVWWTEVLYPVIKDFPVSYVLTWRNAHDRPEHFYGPWKGFENEEDFKKFTEFKQIALI